MRTKNLSAVFAAILLMVIVATSGCAINLVNNGTVSLEKISLKDVHIYKAYVFQDGDEMVISGNVKHPNAIINQGYIDITVFAPDGIIIKQVSVSEYSVSTRAMLNGEASFNVRLSIIPPRGTKVLVEYKTYKQ